MGLRWQALAGIAAFFLFFYLGWVARREPFYTYYYLFAWGPFLWVIDRTLAIRTESSPLAQPREFVWLLAFSATLWLVFEVINFRIHNWNYIGVPAQRWLRWPGYALSFATVVPGILMAHKLLEICLHRHTNAELGMRNTEEGMLLHKASSFRAPNSAFRIGFAATVSLWWSVLGLAMIFLPLIWPRIFFPLIWGGFFFLCEPWAQKLGGHSLINDWREGRWRRTITLLASGLVCGLFWEWCNFGAGSKWRYTLPYWGFGKLFEMPVLGFIGFMPFALEVHAIHQTAFRIWQRMGMAKRAFIVGVMLVFWLAAFYGIDRWTVATRRR